MLVDKQQVVHSGKFSRAKSSEREEYTLDLSEDLELFVLLRVVRLFVRG